MTSLRVGRLSDQQLADYPDMFAGAFLEDPDPDALATARDLIEPDRFTGVFDGSRLIGGGGILTRQMTLPGAGPTSVAAVTYVGVRPDSRGRGALRALMSTQLRQLHEAGREPFAVLWASQAPIYGRYGYGAASSHATLTVTSPAPFRDGVTGGDVSWVDSAAAAAPMRALHRRVAAGRPGWISRPEVSWRWWLSDHERDRGGLSAFRYALHRSAGRGDPDGYAVFRVKQDWPSRGARFELGIKELAAATPEAHAGLWRSLLALDLVHRVRYSHVPLDDPIPLLLVDPRAVLSDVSDGLWVRLVDLDRALAARRYAAVCDLVLAVTDRLCPWNAGHWRLRVAQDGSAEVGATQAAADLECDIADLGAAFLGGTRLVALAGAGRVRELRPGAMLAASRALAGDREPYCPDVF
jgi:predicted acetyltransferase